MALVAKGLAGLERVRDARLRFRRAEQREERFPLEVEDILLTAPMSLTAMQGHGPVAILQVGGFLGMGGRLVAVPLSDLRWNTERERMVMPGATKESLQTRAAFDFDSLRRR